jgi:hypothetical protein
MLRAMDETDEKRKIEEKAYKRKGDLGDVLGLDLGLRGRIETRNQRCQNCQWFDVDLSFDAHFHTCLMRDGRILRDRGATQPVIDAQAVKLRQVILGNRGEVGYCLKRIIRKDPQAGDDFTCAGYLCDQWSGAYGTRFEGAVSKLPDEVLDDMGEKNPPRPGEEHPALEDVRTMQPKPREPSEGGDL